MKLDSDTPPTPGTNHYLPALDGVRGGAILMVTMYRFLKVAFPPSDYGPAIERVVQLGSLGVDLFFVLSGFLITSVLINAKGSPNFFSRFYLRRSLRIFPLYFVSLLFFLWAFPLVSGNRTMFAPAVENQWYLWTYTTNLKMAWQGLWCFGHLDHFWTLAIEEQFYLVWPIAVYYTDKKRLFWTALLLAGLCLIVRTTFCYLSDNGVAGDVFTPFRIDGLLFGAVVSVLIQDRSKFAKLLDNALWWLAALILLNAAFFLGKGRLLEIPHTSVAMMWAAVILLVAHSKRTSFHTLFEAPILRILGKYSYAMYVFQSPLIPIMEPILAPHRHRAFFGSQVVAGLFYVGAMLIVTFVCAVASWWLFEKWFLRLRDSTRTTK